MAADAILPLVGERLRSWAAAASLNPTLRPILFWLILRAVVIAVVCAIFHPIIRAAAKPTLLTYLGMTFGELKVSAWKLKLTIRDAELLPSRSSTLRTIILAIFPSANVQLVEHHMDYPESKVAVRKISIKLRVSSMAGPTLDGDPCTTASRNPHESIFGGGEKKTEHSEARRLKLLYHLIPKLVVVVRLDDVSIEIEKTYLAPEPPERLQETLLGDRGKLPLALSSPQHNREDLPTFHQDSLLQTMQDEEVSDADKISLFVERWIDHARTKTLKKPSLAQSLSFDRSGENEEMDPEAGTTDSQQQTYDEKVNAWITWLAGTLLRRISLEVQNVSVIISGAGSEIVKRARNHHSPSEANLVCARLPKQKRALTAVGAESISVSFSPDADCNALFCFVGLHLKVGDPIPTSQEDGLADVPYAWHTVAHPCHLVAELTGVLPFLIWALNYDYHWHDQSLGLSLSSTEVAVSLSPSGLHTALLHFDDYTDPMSPYNEWLAWLKDTHCQKHCYPLSADEEASYRSNYARVKGAKKEGDTPGKEDELTLSQMKELERRMTRYEIMSLRCFAMKDGWRIPKASKDFSDFLRCSRSTISMVGDERRPPTAVDATSPFERVHPTPLHALVTLLRNNTSILAPHVAIECAVETLHVDFVHEGGDSEAIPSAVTVSDVSFDIDQRNPLTPVSPDLKASRPFLDLSLEVCAVKWDVVDNAATPMRDELPLFRDRSLVGLVYMSEEAVPSKPVLSLGFAINVSPTTKLEPHYGFTFGTTNLVVVVNPLPLLSAMQNLTELSDIPFQPTTDDLLEEPMQRDASVKADVNGSTPLAVYMDVDARVENTQLLFLIDRRNVPRGTLQLNVQGVHMQYESGDLSGKLLLLTKPAVLSAGQIGHEQSSGDWQIDSILMPFQPVIDVDGANVRVVGEECNESDADATRLRLNAELGTESFFFNSSPSTIVALFGVVKSLDPFLHWLQGENNARKEEKAQMEREKRLEDSRQMEFHRQVLKRIFQEIDKDGSGALSEDELELLVVKLFDEESGSSCLGRPTQEELKREKDYLLSIIDPGRANEITFQEIMHNGFFQLANKISDTNLVPTLRYGDRFDGEHYMKSDEFLSGPWLRKLVYYDDLREYSSMEEVYRITGQRGLESGTRFPSPSVWRQGDGIEHFWELFTRETGCTRGSLIQNITLVQQKLVRSLRNYEFAKFCWKTLVQPEMNAASESNAGRFVAHWLLDRDSATQIKAGVIDRLLRHVNTEVKKETSAQDSKNDIQYELRVKANLDSAVLRFGSSHAFANPLFEARLRQMSMNATTLLSSQGWFVPERDNPDNSGEEGTDSTCNRIHFQSSISAKYLNTKHNHMETFLEPYPSFGTAALQLFSQDSKVDRADAVPDAVSFTIHVNCPRFLNITASRSFFETASVLTEVIAQSDPETFRAIIFDRDSRYIKNFWDAEDREGSGILSRDEVLSVMHAVTDMHWKDEMAGLTPAEKAHFIDTFVDLAEREEDGMISLQSILRSFKAYTARCYFSGSKEILLHNDIGRTLKASTKDSLESNLMHHSIMSEADYQRVLGTFLSVEDDSSCALPLSGKLSLATYGYKIIDDVSVSPYQTVMYSLKRKKRGSQRKRRHTNASGFKPFLTVTPENGESLDSIYLDVRTSVTVQSEIPVKIRIVRLGKTAPNFRTRGNRTKLDYSKRGLMASLRRVVEGAPIVYEHSCLKDGAVAPLPLDVLDSSHFHALLIQWNNTWRDPVFLSRDFLHNPTNIRQVTRCHALSGIVVRKERLNVHVPGKHRKSPTANDSTRSILKRTAWDTTIHVMPFFNVVNGLPFPIVVRSWQTSEEDDDELWDEPLLTNAINLEGADEDQSSDEDMSYMTPSINGRRVSPDDVHMTSGARDADHYAENHLPIGKVFSLSGVSLREPLFIQVTQQHAESSDSASFMWTNPLQLDVHKMKTGINPRGQARLSKLILDLGDNCDCLVDVSVASTGVPICTIYAPYWIMNKTGVKMECRVAGQQKSYVDSGSGGLPILIHGSRTQKSNEKYKKASREISIIPLQSPSQNMMAREWWDEASNGALVLQKGPIEEHGRSIVDWSKPIELEAAGTDGEIHCHRYIFNCSIDSLAGVFHRSNLISFTPSFIVKNMLHIAVSIMPLYGGVHDAIRKASHLRQTMKPEDVKRKIDLAPGQTTVIYNFHNIASGVEKPYHWVVFCVNASRYGANYKSKWHLVPVHNIDSYQFGEHDGCSDTMCGIVEAKVHRASTGSMLVSIVHAAVSPFIIENRSSTHHVRLVQDDAEAVVFELGPMSSCSYTWDSPLGKKKLRAVVIPKAESKSHKLDEALEKEREEELLRDTSRDGDDETLDTVDSDDESTKTSGSAIEPLLYSLKRGVKVTSRELNKTARFRTPRKRTVFSLDSRSYRMSKVGRQRELPCPLAEESAAGLTSMSSHLIVHTRIAAGTKILSFSDSSWLADQVEAGILRKGGDWRSAWCSVNIEGVGVYVCDDYPKEVLGVVVRDIQLLKPMGSIETTARVRHFQVDAMLPGVRYPIIIQPLPMGVDRRESSMPEEDGDDGIIPESVDKRELYFTQNDEKPVPVLEVTTEYVPQENMTWIPSLDIFICPLQLRIDVQYILKIVGMVVNSVYKYQGNRQKNLSATSTANDQLKYITHGQLAVYKTYVEKLNISSCYFEMELNIKSEDPDDDGGGDASMTLHSIAQSTNSAAVAGILSWLINVGANFAHVSPCFRYKEETYADEYCDVLDLLGEIAMDYVVHTIKQSYKVVFSMQLLGDPSYLLHQYKLGISDLITKTRDEIKAGGKDGFGKGVTSALHNVVGGTFFAFGKVTGGVADTLDSLTTNDLTSNHLKPNKSASSDGRHPDNAVDGVVEGTKFLGQTLVHGMAGLVGNPYRGAKTGTTAGFAKGVASGATGLVAAPFVGALGFVAKTADGIGATTKYLDLGVIESRCRPARTVPWGRPMAETGLSYLKGIGIHIHTVRYQKIRRRLVVKKDGDDDFDDDGSPSSVDQVSSKEYKRLKAAEERRKNPPRKLVSIMHEKDKYHYTTAPTRPKLLSDAPGNLVLSHYAVTYEETLVLRSSDLQLGDTVAINFWNSRGLKAATTRQTPLGVCKISVGDIYASVLHFYREQLQRKEANLSSEEGAAPTADLLIVPALQECALFRPCKRQTPERRDIFEAIGEEMAAIQKSEEDKFLVGDSDSSDSDSDDSSFLGGDSRKKAKEEDPASMVKANERLFGSISLSFYPIPW